MISEKQIRKIVEAHFIDTDRFVVAINISKNNRIEVLIDCMTNIAIKDCVALSRYIESNLDRETEDFELMVSSAGIDEGLILDKQYIKNVGREVDIVKTDGAELNGVLTAFANDIIELESTRVEKNEKGKKQTIKEQITIPLHEIKETKLVLSFK